MDNGCGGVSEMGDGVVGGAGAVEITDECIMATATAPSPLPASPCCPTDGASATAGAAGNGIRAIKSFGPESGAGVVGGTVVGYGMGAVGTWWFDGWLGRWRCQQVLIKDYGAPPIPLSRPGK